LKIECARLWRNRQPYPHRAIDVFDHLLTQILERETRAVAHLLVNTARDANPTRLR
jgi:hypothetical protein